MDYIGKMNLEQRVSKLERKKTTTIISDIVTIILFIIVIVYMLVIGVRSFYPEKEKVITFNVIGIINDTNATTLTQLHFECIKFCGDNLYSSSNSLNSCFEQCSSIGKELSKDEMCFTNSEGDLRNGVLNYCKYINNGCYSGFLNWSKEKGLYWNNDRV